MNIIERLSEVLILMRKEYIKDPKKSMKNGAFIKPLQYFAIQELQSALGDYGQIYNLHRLDEDKYPQKLQSQLNNTKIQIEPECPIPWACGEKNIDVGLTTAISDPIGAIELRSQMLSIRKNTNNNLEKITGTCSLLHRKNPYLPVAQLFLLPTEQTEDGKLKETDFEKHENFFLAMTGRTSCEAGKDVDKFERIGFIKVDFNTEIPTILPTCPELSIETFFEDYINIVKNKYNLDALLGRN